MNFKSPMAEKNWFLSSHTRGSRKENVLQSQLLSNYRQCSVTRTEVRPTQACYRMSCVPLSVRHPLLLYASPFDERQQLIIVKFQFALSFAIGTLLLYDCIWCPLCQCKHRLYRTHSPSAAEKPTANIGHLNYF